MTELRQGAATLSLSPNILKTLHGGKLVFTKQTLAYFCTYRILFLPDFSFPHWQCLDHCDAAFFLQGLPHFPERFMLPPNGPDPDALGAGCYFGNWAATHPNSFAIPCATERYSRRELAIAFVNSKDQGQYATTGECQTYVCPYKKVSRRFF